MPRQTPALELIRERGPILRPRRRPSAATGAQLLSTFRVGARSWSAPYGAEVFRAAQSSDLSVRYVRMPTGFWRIYTTSLVRGHQRTLGRRRPLVPR